MGFGWVDLIILFIMAFSVFTGMARGFLKEAVSLGVWILAIWLAYHYAQQASSFFAAYISNATVRLILGGAAILLVTLIIGGLCNFILGMFLSGAGFGLMDSVLGTCFGFARGALIVALLLCVANMIQGPQQAYIRESKLYPKFQPLENWLNGHLQTLLRQLNKATGF